MTKFLVEILCFVFLYLSKVLVFGKSSQLFFFSFLMWYGIQTNILSGIKDYWGTTYNNSILMDFSWNWFLKLNTYFKSNFEKNLFI